MTQTEGIPTGCGVSAETDLVLAYVPLRAALDSFAAETDAGTHVNFWLTVGQLRELDAAIEAVLDGPAREFLWRSTRGRSQSENDCSQSENSDGIQDVGISAQVPTFRNTGDTSVLSDTLKQREETE
jgi:hypothetical protein